MSNTSGRPPARVAILQHAVFEGPGFIGTWLKSHGFDVKVYELYAGSELPEMGALDWLIIMGGPMNIYEDDLFPWLKAERQFIKKAVQDQKLILGICLGAQFLADALGQWVHRGEYREIGWHPVYLTDLALQSKLFHTFPEEIQPFHWHGDTFDTPPEATRIGASNACKNQGFLYQNRVLALQFHLEVTLEDIDRIITNCGQDLHEDLFVQARPEVLKNAGYITAANKYMAQILERMANSL
jgi:GMP synthase (glutamine-hydrolysing)